MPSSSIECNLDQQGWRKAVRSPASAVLVLDDFNSQAAFMNKTFLLACLSAFLPVLAQADILALYDFNALNGTPSSTHASGETPGTFAGSGITVSFVTKDLTTPTSGAAQGTGWSLASSIDTSKYFEFAVTPDSGKNFDVTQISFLDKRYHVGGTRGPQDAEVRFFTGAGLTPVTLSSSQTFSPGNALATFTSTFSPFTTPVGQILTVRIYGWNATDSTKELWLDNVQLSGTVVPEPSTYLAGLSALGLLGFQCWRSRKVKPLAAA